MAFPETDGIGENTVGAGLHDVEFQEVFVLKAVDLGRPGSTRTSS
jgi:hypothetical protein